MNERVIFLLLALTAGGAGLGAGFASALLTSKQIYPGGSAAEVAPVAIPPSPEAIPASGSDSACLPDGLMAVTASLHQARALEAIATDPIAIATAASEQLTPDLLAQLNPAPWPHISDRARSGTIPVIMYHDITPTKDVDYDVTPEELEKHFQAIQDEGLTPISLDRLVTHLRTGAPLPAKPILLTFDDNYAGQYEYAFPLLKRFGYPAVWSVHTGFVGSTAGTKPKANWEQLREMVASGLITIASHSVTHRNFSTLTPAEITKELTDSKQVLERELGVPIRYFTYPEGSYASTTKELVAKAGYTAALTMRLDRWEETFANASEDLLAIERFGQSRLLEVIAKASSGDAAIAEALVPPGVLRPVHFEAPVQKREVTIDNLPLTLVFGGKPVTVHADTRAQVAEIVQQVPDAVAAVDGGFFSLERIDGNTMIGPVLSQYSSQPGILNPGNRGENPLLAGRPLVLIGPTTVKFVPYEPKKHDTIEGMRAELADVTDAFVAAGWLVRNGKPQPAESFGKLYGFDAHRDRAFWGIDRAGRPVIGVTMDTIDSVGLGKILAKAGMQDIVMLDSGASAALAYRGKSVMSYEPRPVPHIVALRPPEQPTASAPVAACTPRITQAPGL